MWDPPRLGIKPMFPALAGGFSSTAPTGKSAWTVIQLSVMSIWYMNCSSNPIFPFNFVSEWSIHCWSVVLESLLLLHCYSAFRSINICLIYLGDSLLVFMYLQCYYLLMGWSLYHYTGLSLSLVTDKSILSKYRYPCSLLVSIYIEYLFPFICFQLMNVFKVEVNLL